MEASLYAGCTVHQIFFVCNRWRVVHHSECSAHCGHGMRNLTKQCEQESLIQSRDHQSSPISIPVDDRHCRHLTDAPPDTEPCTGTCHSAHWQFYPWSQVCRAQRIQCRARLLSPLDRLVNLFTVFGHVRRRLSDS